MSEGRVYFAAAGAGNNVLFAGGSGSKSVDIYNTSNNLWTTTQLPEQKDGLAGVGVGNMIIFAGGATNNYSKTANIYDVYTKTWKNLQLSEARTDLVGAGIGNKILFAGGYKGGSASAKVDIFTLK